MTDELGQKFLLNHDARNFPAEPLATAVTDSSLLAWGEHVLGQRDYPWLGPLREAVGQITYRDWQFVIDIEDYGAPYLQIRFEDPTMEPTTQYCRKWLLYPTMNVSDFVRTCWAAVMQAEEHEARERFAYKSRHVMSPHFDMDVLAELARYKANLALSPDPVPSK